MKTQYHGIDYSHGKHNVDKTNGIHYGVINQHAVGDAWFDSSEPQYYPCEECPEGECECDLEPYSWAIDNEEYVAECGEDGDIFVIRSPYYTFAQFCSPCAPGACYLTNWLDASGPKAYCFGHDWFDDGQAPYPVYSVATGELVTPEG